MECNDFRINIERGYIFYFAEEEKFFFWYYFFILLSLSSFLSFLSVGTAFLRCLFFPSPLVHMLFFPLSFSLAFSFCFSSVVFLSSLSIEVHPQLGATSVTFFLLLGYEAWELGKIMVELRTSLDLGLDLVIGPNSSSTFQLLLSCSVGGEDILIFHSFH